jgi:tRNA uridine 5-carboxymethylaminomethyl modification enzyme
VDEPYRLFTSRAEFRLLLRQDNALKRLGPLATRLGLLTDTERAELDRRVSHEDEVLALARRTSIAAGPANTHLRAVGEREVGETQRVLDLARRPHASVRELLGLSGAALPDLPDETWLSTEIEIKYAGYLERERAAARRLAELTEFRLPVDLPYAELRSLSTESRQKLASIRPESLAQAARVPGVSPSDLQNLVLEVVRRRRAVA